MHILKFAPIVLTSSLITACGGGDDSSSSTDSSSSENNGSTTNTTVAITTQNANHVTGNIYGMLSNVGSVGESGGNVATGAVVHVNSDFNQLDFTKQARKRLRNWDIQTSPSFVTSAVLDLGNIPCLESGNHHFVFDDKDNNQDLSDGDTVTWTFDNCVEEGETTDGMMFITIIGNEPNLAMNFVLTDLTITDSDGTYTLNGEINTKETIQETENGTIASFFLTSDSITMTQSGTTEKFTNFSLNSRDNLNTLVSEWETKGTFHSTELDGSVSFETLQQFEEFEDDYPYVGIMKITGHNNSSITLTALDAVNVRLQIDENGDGAVDQTYDVAWNTLDII